MGTEPKRDGVADLHWDDCKIIEERENGELVLLENNLKSFLQRMKKEKLVSGGPLVFTSFVGSPSGGNAFFTNLLAAHREINGASWPSKIKTSGLKGFSYGSALQGSRNCKLENLCLEADPEITINSSAEKEKSISEKDKTVHTSIVNDDNAATNNVQKHKEASEREKNQKKRSSCMPWMEFIELAQRLLEKESEIEQIEIEEPGCRKIVEKLVVAATKKLQSVDENFTDDEEPWDIIEVPTNRNDPKSEESNRAVDGAKYVAIAMETDASADEKNGTHADEDAESLLLSEHEDADESSGKMVPISLSRQVEETTERNGDMKAKEGGKSNVDSGGNDFSFLPGNKGINGNRYSKRIKNQKHPKLGYRTSQRLAEKKQIPESGGKEKPCQPGLEDKKYINKPRMLARKRAILTPNGNNKKEADDPQIILKGNGSEVKAERRAFPNDSKNDQVSSSFKNVTSKLEEKSSESDENSTASAIEIDDSQLNCENSEDSQHNSLKQSHLNNGMFHPDQVSSGIYFWPKFYQLNHNSNTLLGILYAHHVNSEPKTEKDVNLLDRVLALLCSILVEIQWEDNTTGSSLQKNVPDPRQRVIKLVNSEPADTASQEELTFNFFIDLKHGTNIDENNGLHLTTRQCRAVDKLVKAITDDVNLNIPAFGSRNLKSLTTSNLGEFLQDTIAKVSKNKFTSSPGGLSLAKTPSSKTKPILKEKPTPRKINFESKSCSGTEESRSRSVTPNKVIPTEETKQATDDNTGAVKALPSASPEPEDNQTFSNDPPNFLQEIVMLETISSCWDIFQSKLKSWMQSSDISLETVLQISKIYEENLQQLYDNQFEVLKAQNLSPENVARYAQMLKENVDKELRQRGSSIQSGLTFFLENVEKNSKLSTKNHANHHHPDSEKSPEQILENVLRHTERHSWELIQLGAAKVMEQYKAKEEIAYETCLVGTKIVRSCQQTYFNQQLSSNQTFDPIISFKSHEMLTRDMLLAYTEIFGSRNKLSKILNDLRQLLIDDFFDFHTKGMRKLEMQMREISSLIEKLKKDYEDQMDALLKENPNGLEEVNFESEHHRVLQNCAQKLVELIGEEIHSDEPTDGHVLALQMGVEKIYKFLKAENNAALENSNQKDKEDIAPTESFNCNQKDLGTFSNNRELNNRTAVEPELVRKKLPTKQKILLLQIAFDKIGAASIQINSVQKEVEEMNFYPAVVALTQDDEWLFGNDACSYSESCKRTWSIADCWSQGNWVEEMLVDGQHFSINVDFLLSVLITAIKRKFEDDSTEAISESLVSVPYWFNSFHRQQVLNAAGVSGLARVQLINENSCSAFFMYTSSSHNQKFDTVVISENSLKVDISLYSYDSSRSLLTLRGHCGDYEAMEASKDNTGMIKYIYGILHYFAGHWQEVGAEDEALKNLDQLWQLTLTRAGIDKPGSEGKQRKVLVCCESDQWRDFLWKLACRISDPEFISVRADTPLYGLASIYLSPTFRMLSNMQSDIADSSPFHAEFVTPKGESIKAVYSDGRIQKFEINKKSEFSTFYRIHQVNSGINRQVATFTLKKLPKYFTNVTVSLERSLNGLLSVRSVEYTKKDTWGIRSYTFPISSNFYVWESFSFCEKDKTALKSFLRQIKWCRQKPLSCAGARLEETIKLGEKIKNDIVQGLSIVKSNDGKESVLEMIEKSLKSLQHPSVPDYFVQQQKEIFSEMSKMYKIQL